MMIKFECEEQTNDERIVVYTTSFGRKLIVSATEASLLEGWNEYVIESKIYVPENTERPTFGEVEENQFFIDTLGYLCQKVDEETCNILTNDIGEPYCMSDVYILGSNSIKKILPKVTKITWGNNE